MHNKKFRSYRYQQLGHETLLLNSDFRQLGAIALGVYLRLRLEAGLSRQMHDCNDGDLYHRGHRLKLDELARFLVDELCDVRMPAAQSLLANLKKAGLIHISRAGYVSIAHWNEEQLAPPSDSASGKRAARLQKDMEQARHALKSEAGRLLSEDVLSKTLSQRLGKRDVAQLVEALVDADVVVKSDSGQFLVRADSLGNEDRGAARPRPPSRESREEADMSATSPPESRGRLVKEENTLRVREEGPPDDSRQDPPGPRPASRGGAGARSDRPPAFRSGKGCDPRSVDVYAEQPVRAALLLTGESGPRSERGFTKKLEALIDAHGESTGVGLFRQCLKELRSDLLEGRPVENPGAVLHGKVKGFLPEKPPVSVDAHRQSVSKVRHCATSVG